MNSNITTTLKSLIKFIKPNKQLKQPIVEYCRI